MNQFFNTLLSVLKEDVRFFSEDGIFLRNSVYESAMKMDEKLLHLLLNNEETKKHFFKKVDDILVFDKVRFGWVINNREFLPDSYTRFKNKIGLADKSGNLISDYDDIELVFPYKDCVLEGGQSKEDIKREEIFYNELLAPKEIDRMFEPKVLTNAIRHEAIKDAKGLRVKTSSVEKVLPNDNLIIYGNNLLVLKSLIPRFKGKVKCIYIDPPYYFASTKKEDTFAYNSNFKLSSWLTFMKNRLEVARDLLSDEGAIFVQISNDGVAELMRLIKEIFNRNGDNFINIITVKTKSPSGFSTVNPGVFEAAEFIIAFAKNKKCWKYHPQFVETSYDSNYKWYITNKSDNFKQWNIVSLNEFVSKEKGFKSVKDFIKAIGEAAFNDLIAKFALDHADSVFRYTAIGKAAGNAVINAKELSKKHMDEIYEVPREGKYTVYVYKAQEIAFYSKKIKEIDGKRVPAIQLSDIWIDTPYEGIAKEGKVTLKGGKKPEKLLKRIIEMSTNPGDLVLDFFSGSGTTCAVAHKLGRQYIGVEQLEYEQNGPISRLETVISGDKSGISKIVNWNGGGSYISCELAKLNQEFIDEISHISSANDLKIIYYEAGKSGFISCNVNLAKINLNATDFESLSLDDQKRFLMEILDKNLLYVNYCDIDDEEFHISEKDKAFTRSFYEEG